MHYWTSAVSDNRKEAARVRASGPVRRASAGAASGPAENLISPGGPPLPLLSAQYFITARAFLLINHSSPAPFNYVPDPANVWLHFHRTSNWECSRAELGGNVCILCSRDITPGLYYLDMKQSCWTKFAPNELWLKPTSCSVNASITLYNNHD